MKYEVEQKFRVDDLSALLHMLQQRNLALGEPIEQVDRYFNHPSRDFAQTDEALRIRSVGDRNWMTFKGPKLAGATKTRRELEFPIADGHAAAEQMAELLQLLSFRPTAVVRKRRQGVHLEQAGRAFEILLDHVDQVGQFVEIETLAEQDELSAAQAALLALAGEFGLGQPERRSYLEMLLSR